MRLGDEVVCIKDKRSWNGKRGIVKKITASGIAHVQWPRCMRGLCPLEPPDEALYPSTCHYRLHPLDCRNRFGTQCLVAMRRP